MSAATEELLQQIFITEKLIQEKSAMGQDTTQLQEQLDLLREKFNTLNEDLGKNASLLKG